MNRDVAILDIKAGGGHKTASESIYRSLEDVADINATRYEFKTEQAEKLHNLWTNTPILRKLYDIGHTLAEKKWVWHLKGDVLDKLAKITPSFDFLKSVGEIEQEAIEFMEKNPEIEIFISTHFFITDALLKVRSRTNKEFKIIVFVPDFDKAFVHFKMKRKQYPDAIIARSSEMIEMVRDIYDVPAMEAGFIPDESFIETGRMDKNDVWANINNYGGNFNRLNKEKRIVTLVAGSQWVNFLYKNFKKILSYIGEDCSSFQFIVITGLNKNAYTMYEELNNDREENTVVPFGFITKDKLASLYKASEYIIMGSVAPATIYELLASTEGQIIINRTNPGQEKPNKKYMLENKLAVFEGNPERISTMLLSEPKPPIKHYRETSQRSIDRAYEIADFIRNNFN